MDAGLQGRRDGIGGQSRRRAALFGSKQKWINQRVNLVVDILRGWCVWRIGRGCRQSESRRWRIDCVTCDGRDCCIKRNRIGRRGRNHRYVVAPLISDVDFIRYKINRCGLGK